MRYSTIMAMAAALSGHRVMDDRPMMSLRQATPPDPQKFAPNPNDVFQHITTKERRLVTHRTGGVKADVRYVRDGVPYVASIRAWAMWVEKAERIL